ncbi:hypothetical protein [Halobacterium litoreum]|uniref:Flagellar protein FlaJ n=1 Tax=Halobacterium litoreum TaxID=2039234 RepID=A0ABD5NG13_9EURY|nr:hypothetical protein [Halobacterium litoreum]UHH12933.1 hypothetical protein LT972_12295 [Halobacterium litoreum]
MGDDSDGSWSGATDLPAKRWLLLTGDRVALAAGFSLVLVTLTLALVETDVVYVGDGSTYASVLSSGMLGALATIVTVTLSINQLILSRVFGSPADLTDQLEGNLDFRRTVEDIADLDSSPNDPGSFLAVVAETLESEAAALERTATDADLDDDVTETVTEFTSSVVEYADRLAAGRDSESTFEVLSLTFGTEYADLMDDARGIQRGVAADLPDDADGNLDAILELLKAVAVVRQFFKTLAVQQDLASLSRQLIYTGVPAILVTYYLAQVYTAAAPMLPGAWLPGLAAVATAVVFSPLSVLVAYILRVATVTLYTVSVGSFIPPEERVDSP